MAKVASDFPAGLRVLAIDHDITVLESIEQMCTRCQFQVVTCSNAQHALDHLRQRSFDVILVDAQMPNNFGFEVLQGISKEIDVPAIMMSGDATRSVVEKAITYGARDYWIKPLPEEQIRNIWQHVARKFWSENKGHEIFGSLENDGKKRRNDDSENASSVVDAAEGGVARDHKESNSKEADVDESKKNNSKETYVDESENCYIPSTKKHRVVWSTELHQKFVAAVMQLGLDKAMPKRILEVMNDPNLTRENVASHLQKFRIGLKRSEGGTLQQNGMPSSNTIFKQGTFGRSDYEALAAAGHVPYETSTDIYANNMMPRENQTALLKPAIQWPNRAQQAVVYAHPLANYPPPIIVNNFPQSIMTVNHGPSRYAAWPPPNTNDSVRVNSSVEQLAIHTNKVPMDALQQQQQLKQEHQMQDQFHSINVQPSSMVVSGSPATVNQNFSIGQNSIIDYGSLSSQSNYSADAAQFFGQNNQVRGISYGCTAPPSFLQPTLTTSFPRGLPPVSTVHVPYGYRSGESLYQESLMGLGYDGRDTCISSGSARLETNSSVSSLSNQIDVENNIAEEQSNSMNSSR